MNNNYMVRDPRTQRRHGPSSSSYTAPLVVSTSQGDHHHHRRRRHNPHPHRRNQSRRRRTYQQELEVTSRQQQYNPPSQELFSENYYSSGVAEDSEDVLMDVTPSIILQKNTNFIGEDALSSSSSILPHGLCCMQCVRTQEVGIVENCGAFDEIVGPGLYCSILWPCSTVVSWLSLRVQQVDITCETKTKDNVFVYIRVSVLYRVIIERAYDAYYSMTDPIQQIKCMVFDVVRSEVPTLSLNDVFDSKSYISDCVFTRLQSVMKEFGYEIEETLVGSIVPNEIVKTSMNEIYASKLLKQAMVHKAEAEKIRIVKEAEGIMEGKYLDGVGTSKQRRAIAQGVKESMIDLPTSSHHPDQQQDFTTEDTMNILLLTQYMDTLGAVGSNEVFMNTLPSEILDKQAQSPPTNNNPIIDLLS